MHPERSQNHLKASQSAPESPQGNPKCPQVTPRRPKVFQGDPQGFPKAAEKTHEHIKPKSKTNYQTQKICEAKCLIGLHMRPTDAPRRANCIEVDSVSNGNRPGTQN